jgi:hypothetical protein
LLRRKGLAYVPFVAGLPADGTLLAVGPLRRFRLDDVRRRRLRRRLGVFLGGGQLGTHSLEFRFDRGHLGLKYLALGTRLG